MNPFFVHEAGNLDAAAVLQVGDQAVIPDVAVNPRRDTANNRVHDHGGIDAPMVFFAELEFKAWGQFFL